MTLYEIDKNIEEAFDKAIDPDTGEIISEEAYAEFCQLNMDRDTKIENVGLWIKDLNAEATAIKAEADNLTARRRAIENKVKGLQSYIDYALEGEKFKTPRLSVSYRKSSSVVVSDIRELPERFLRYREPEADKNAIKEALKAGETVNGAELVENMSIIIK